MPHATGTFPFEPGDDDLGDFMLDIWLPFARDSCNWVNNRAPAVGTRPNIELWTHRGSTVTPEPPYIYFRTSAQHMHIFTGNGIDLAQEIYDQPANPGNAPRNTSFGVPASGSVTPDMRCIFMNSLNGPYSAYWLFSDTTGEYIHCVVKVNSLQYRHFTVGKLRQADGGNDLHADSFYVAGHFWEGIGTERIGWPTSVSAGDEHAPYGNHQTPFRNRTGTSANGAFGIAQLGTAPPCHLYMPGLNPITVTGATVNAGGTGHAVNDIITLSLNDGTGPVTPTLRVTAEAAGVITAVSVENAGDLTNRIYPNTAVAQASTTGTGINATFDLTQVGHSWYMTQSHDGLTCLGSPVDKSESNPGTAVGDVNEQVHIGVAQSNAYDAGLGTMLWACDRNFTANANVLIPIYISAAFDFASDIRQGVVAQIPDMFRVNMRDYSAEEVITVGGQDYIVFPMVNNDSVSPGVGDGYSGYEGIAYRRETGLVV